MSGMTEREWRETWAWYRSRPVGLMDGAPAWFTFVQHAFMRDFHDDVGFSGDFPTKTWQVRIGEHKHKLTGPYDEARSTAAEAILCAMVGEAFATLARAAQ